MRGLANISSLSSTIDLSSFLRSLPINAHVAFTYLVIQMKVELDANLQETEKYQVKVLFKQKAQIKIKPLKTKERSRVALNAKCYEV